MRGFLFLLVFSASQSFGQQFEISGGYSYLYSSKLDKLVQTYNFSRPDLTQLQPVLAHGFSTGFLWNLHSEQDQHAVLGIRYSQHNSYAENNGFSNQLRLHQVTLDYGYAFSMKKFQTVLGASIQTGSMQRFVNDTDYEYDSEQPRALAIGMELNVLEKYRIWNNEKLSVSAFLSLHYTPYLYAPYFETAINQTTGLYSKYFNYQWQFNGGLLFGLKK